MNDKTSPMKVNIMDKEYMVGCPDGERDALFASAEFLNSKMKETRDQGKIVGADRIAVMAALNMAYELLESRNNKDYLQTTVGPRIRALQEKIDAALNQDKQLEF